MVNRIPISECTSGCSLPIVSQDLLNTWPDPKSVAVILWPTPCQKRKQLSSEKLISKHILSSDEWNVQGICSRKAGCDGRHCRLLRFIGSSKSDRTTNFYRDYTSGRFSIFNRQS